nr:MAG TPA: hypothetical protein [Caudoviricetes sp.]DAV59793.1 MAG TPA: hypothetical protein [Caudoviricetes sp.]
MPILLLWYNAYPIAIAVYHRYLTNHLLNLAVWFYMD